MIDRRSFIGAAACAAAGVGCRSIADSGRSPVYAEGPEAMKAVLRKKGQRIVFIHGKGDGVLRKAILTELKTKYPACKWQDASFKEYGYGATMITM